MTRVGASPLTMAALGLLAALKAAALVEIAEAIASGVVSVIAGTDAWRGAVLLGLASGLLRALCAWAVPAVAVRAAIAAKSRLRHDLVKRALAAPFSDVHVVKDGPTQRERRGSEARPGTGVGSATVIGTVGLDELDAYYRTVLPAIVTTAVVPLLIGARILTADWVSAVIIVLTVPLVPVFMALVGMHSKDQADAASGALQRLSDHLVELARGLPVLVGLGRVQEQTRALRAISERHRTTTMLTLRSAFLSALVLELIATISVAVVAVFVGIRLVNGDLPLAVGLVALVLAPECFTPFRELGSAFHAAQDGLAARRRAVELTDTPIPTADRRTAQGVRLVGLEVRHAEREEPVIDGLDLAVAPLETVSIEGPSGSGKSTLLGVLAGVVAPTAGRVEVPEAIAWVPQHPRFVGSTVRAELELYAAGDAHVDRAITDLGLDAVADSDPARLSTGEQRRVAVARGLVRVAAGADMLLLDEPTAHLDSAHARLVEQAVAALRGRVTIVFASHEEGMRQLADRHIGLAEDGGVREVEGADELLAAPAQRNLAAPTGRVLPELLAFLRPMGWRLPLAVATGAAASLFAVALIAVSGWLIVRASEHPPIMYLTVAIVGVRFFGIGRAALRYSERLLTHGAVLGSLTELRMRLWAGLAEHGIASRALATGPAALDYIVSAGDRVRDLVPRVLLPAAVAVVTGGAALIAVAALHAPAVPLLASALVVCIAIAPIAALAADRASSRALDTTRSMVVRQFAAVFGAAGDLRANGVAERALARLTHLDGVAGRAARRSAGALGLGAALVVLACTSASALMLAASAAAVAAGTLPGAVVAVLVLIPLALIEPMLGAVDAAQQWPALRDALARVAGITEPAPRSAPTVDLPLMADQIELRALRVGWADGTGSRVPVTAWAKRGDWVVVEGPSGSGKSTLLATLLGFIAPASGQVLIDGVDASAIDPQRLRRHIAWCPQEAHLFDSTIRGNLLLARDHGDQPTDIELFAALDAAGLSSLVASMPLGLDTPVGAAGDRLSGGERQRLAVARTLLTRADIVLLDEPTAHLDEASAARLMDRLRVALADRIVVLVSHHASEVRVGDERITVAEPAEAARR